MARMKITEMETAMADGTIVATKHGCRARIIGIRMPRKVYGRGRDFVGHTSRDGVRIERLDREGLFVREDTVAPSDIRSTWVEFEAAEARRASERTAQADHVAASRTAANEAAAAIRSIPGCENGVEVVANGGYPNGRITGYSVKLAPNAAARLASFAESGWEVWAGQ